MMRYPRIIHAFIAVALMALLPEGARAQTRVQELTRECDAKNWQSCVLLGFRYRDGEGVPKDPVKAGALQEKACNAGYGGGCVSLAFLWEDGALGDDVAKVIRLRIRGCELKDGSGCHHLGQMYLTGEGVTQDVARAIKLYEQACDELEDGDSCMELHFMLEKGDVIPRDKKRSDAYYERGCDLEALLCVMAFNGYLNPLEDSCEKGGLASCLEVGHMHLSGEAYLKVDEAEASKYFQKACDGNLADACATLGWVFDYSKQTPRNPAKAVANYQKACTGKYAYGCQMLGIHYLRGDGVPMDERRAADLLRTACNVNIDQVADSCWLLAVLYAEGAGVAKDPARAAVLNAQACRLGKEDVCAAHFAAPIAAKPANTGCSIVKVQLGTDTFASVQSDIKRRGGDASGGTNNGKRVLNAMSGDFSDIWPAVMNVGYTFDGEDASARLIGVMIVTHANTNAEFDKLRAARQAASAAVVKAAGATCATRLVPNADTWFVHEFYELRTSP